MAETVAVTDLIAAGRLHTVLAAAYAHHEFAAFRKSLKDRATLMDQGEVQQFHAPTRALRGSRRLLKCRKATDISFDAACG